MVSGMLRTSPLSGRNSGRASASHVPCSRTFQRPLHPRPRLPTHKRRFPPISAAEEQSLEASTSKPAEEAPREAVCEFCGVPKAEIPGGCDGQGRIAGGLGAVLGFEWWPIKAYRPCPAAAKQGLRYRRKGQITDEVLFGRSNGGKG